MKKIQLTRGKYALVDDGDFEWLSQWKWHCTVENYACRWGSKAEGDRHRKTIRMHREIAQPADGEYADHINGDRLDNRRENLRSCKHFENVRSQKLRVTNKSGYKGVFWHKVKRKYAVSISVDYRRIHIGHYIDIKDAARAYNKAALTYHGDFAKLNNITP